jgi:hypothetical protein
MRVGLGTSGFFLISFEASAFTNWSAFDGGREKSLSYSLTLKTRVLRMPDCDGNPAPKPLGASHRNDSRCLVQLLAGLVEAVMTIEEILGTEIPYNDAENFGSPREMVDWLELHLSNQRPTKEAAALLKRLAKAHNNPELAEGLEGTWRREQIAAIVREMFRQ